MTRPARVVIDRGAARANLALARAFAPRQKIMAVIKADGYGHGLLRMADALRDADAFGVACLEEATQLREAGETSPIVLLEGPFAASELPEVRQFMGGLADGPVAFHYPASDYSAELLDQAVDAK